MAAEFGFAADEYLHADGAMAFIEKLDQLAFLLESLEQLFHPFEIAEFGLLQHPRRPLDEYLPAILIDQRLSGKLQRLLQQPII